MRASVNHYLCFCGSFARCVIVIGDEGGCRRAGFEQKMGTRRNAAAGILAYRSAEILRPEIPRLNGSVRVARAHFTIGAVHNVVPVPVETVPFRIFGQITGRRIAVHEPLLHCRERGRSRAGYIFRKRRAPRVIRLYARIPRGPIARCVDQAAGVRHVDRVRAGGTIELDAPVNGADTGIFCRIENRVAGEKRLPEARRGPSGMRLSIL